MTILHPIITKRRCRLMFHLSIKYESQNSASSWFCFLSKLILTACYVIPHHVGLQTNFKLFRTSSLQMAELSVKGSMADTYNDNWKLY